jgi:uncharacterized protein
MENPKKVIAIDSDEIISAFMDGFIEYNNSFFGTKLTMKDIVSFELGQILGITEFEVEKRIEKFFESGEAKKIKLVEGAKDGVKKLLEMNYEIHVITARPLPLKDETLRWINEHFPNQFKQIHFAFNPYVGASEQKKKSQICKEIGSGILVDDNLVNVLDCAKAGINVLLMDALWNQTQDLPERVVRVKSWNEILDLIPNIQYPIPNKQSL